MTLGLTDARRPARANVPLALMLVVLVLRPLVFDFRAWRAR
jgi:cytochrome bd-type quinol oxidase subunit 2